MNQAELADLSTKSKTWKSVLRMDVSPDALGDTASRLTAIISLFMSRT